MLCRFVSVSNTKDRGPPCCADLYQYPIPNIEDLHAALRGCKTFSILDMSQAYHQIPLAKDCQPYFTINTDVRMFAVTRLPNGVISGLAMCQQILDTVLAGIPHVICYLDDILVAGIHEDEHLHTLSIVFQKFLDAGFHLNKSHVQASAVVCVVYLAHVIDAEGLTSSY